MKYAKNRKLFSILSLLLLALLAQKSGQNVRACCSLAPAHFASTKGFAGQSRKDGKLIHILAYQNAVQNKSSGGNAMFLPIPAKAGSMTKDNIISTEKFPHFLEHMIEAMRRQELTFAVPKTLSEGSMGAAAAPIVFEHGIYTIVLAQNAQDIPKALERVPKEKRPGINKEIFSAYSKWYPGWTFALCCFNNKDAKLSTPMLWWYEPLDPTTLFFPALDAHSGAVPKLDADVYVGHALAFSSPALTERKGGKAVQYRDFSGKGMPDSLMPFLPNLVCGQEFYGNLPQGDFQVKIADLNKGNCLVERVLPPGLKRASLGAAEKLLKPAPAPQEEAKLTVVDWPQANRGLINIAPYRNRLKKEIRSWNSKLKLNNVILSIELLKDGTVKDLKIVQSSGSAQTDRKILENLRNFDFEPLPDKFLGKSLTLRVPLSE